MGKFKSYVRNTASPEGCIAECYIGDEVMEYVTCYFNDIEMSNNNDDNTTNNVSSPSHTLFPEVDGKPVGAGQIFYLDPIQKMQAHRHVLTSYSCLDTYRE